MDPYELGETYAATQDPGLRTARGAWFTPPSVARRLVAEAATRWGAGARPPTVLDAAVGGGAFLLAARERWPTARLVGVDRDPRALSVAEQALRHVGADPHLQEGDGLDPAVTGTADVILGNPPFLSQLQSSTSRDPARRAVLRSRFGPAAAGYVDEAALFLLAAAGGLEEGGVAVMVVPEAVLSTASAAGMRTAVDARCDVEVVWRDTAGVFPGVPTCAVALSVRARAPRPRPHLERAGAWAVLLAGDVPAVDPPSQAVLGDIATATADFRDAYYLVADHAVEGAADDVRPRITPVGLIDPAHHRWGQTGVRFAKRRFSRPVAEGLPPDFLAGRSGSKVLLATQSRVLEALVDDAGQMLPTTPVITLRTPQPWHLAAALTSPVLTAVAARRHAGAARSRSALKLSARQVLDLPCPAGPSEAWDEAAQAIRAAHQATTSAERHGLLERGGALMWTAYAMHADPAATRWWASRLPRRADPTENPNGSSHR